MPSLKEIKTRIASVNSTRKVTSAMKMVASSKLHHAQVAIQNMLPYENLLEHIMKSFLLSMQDQGVNSPYLTVHKQIKCIAIIAYTSNSSLCGGFNNAVIKKLQQTIDGYKTQGIADIVVYPIGRKVEDYVKQRGIKTAGSFLELAEKPDAVACSAIAKEVALHYKHGDFDKVDMIFHHFKSAGSQVLTYRTLIPIDLSTEAIGAENDRDLSSNVATAKVQEYLRRKKETARKRSDGVMPLNDDFIVEPDLHTVLQKLIPNQLDLSVYTALLDSNASEHAARMVAMQTATDNADDLLKSLNLQYNKSRQQAITNELLDIVSGSVNN